MRIVREIIEPRHRWRAIDNKRMAKVCKDVRKLIVSYLVIKKQTDIREYMIRECKQCFGMCPPYARLKCDRCPQEICFVCERSHGPDENFDLLCVACHEETLKIDRNAWALIKKFLIQKCHKCTKMITAGAWKCGTCSKWHCEGCGMGTDVYKSVDGTWEYSHRECWDCGYQRAHDLDMIITQTW